jgi:hypothetical protein
MKTSSLHILYAIICSLILSCKEGVTQEELIRTAVDLKLEQWRQTKFEECRQEAMADAEAYVDSILVIYSLPSKLDTIHKPPKPSKPPKPFFKVRPDSVVVQKPDTI